jgi:3-hydroxy-9,10-secoandrosta-1,3,5(10)-triene-9,17-dione monooxygenase
MASYSNYLSNPLSSEVAILSPEALVARARALQPALRARAAEANRRRDVPKDTIEDFHHEDLFRVLRSKCYGGFEGDPRLFFDIQNAIAEACASSAWVYGVLSVQYLVLVTFDEKAQAEVFADNPQTLVSSSYVPTGTAQAVEGGYRLSGCWPFSSGSTHAGWVLVGAMVPSRESGGTPEKRLFLLPRKDYRIGENWDTFGLCGTGSNDIVIEAAFVPAYRSVRQTMGVVPLADDGTHKSPLHRLPWLYVFTASISNLSIGMTRGALKAFLDAMQTRVNTMGKAMKDNAAVHDIAVRALAEADSAEAIIRRHIAQMLEAIATGKTVTIQEGLLCRVQLSSILVRLAAIVDSMQTLMSGRGIRNDAPLTRIWLDLMAARQHPGNDSGIPTIALGPMLIATAAADAQQPGMPAR